MNYLGNVEFLELEKDNYLIKNNLIGIVAIVFNINPNKKVDGVFLYKSFNVRDGKETFYGFIDFEQYKLFLYLKNNTKSINTSLLAEFSSLSDIKKSLVIEGKETLKGLGKANLDKIKEIYKDGNNEIDTDKYESLKTFIKDIGVITFKEKELDKFVEKNYSDLTNLSKVEIIEYVTKKGK